MLRYCVACWLFIGLAGQARASSWADGMFDELARDFGSVPRGQTLTHPFRLVNNTGQTVAINGVRVSCGCVSAHELQKSLAPGQETVIFAQMDTRRFSNHKAVTVYVTFTQPKFEEVRLTVQANSRDDLTFTPEALAFGKVKRGASSTANMTITVFGSPLQILEAKSESNYVQPSFTEVNRTGGQTTYKIEANLRPDTPPGKWFTDVWVKTNNSSMPKIRVPVTVEVEPALSVSPANVTMGRIKAGAEVDHKVIIRGPLPFKITAISGTDKQLLVKEAKAQSQSVHVLTVTLRPNQIGELYRTIRVTTDTKDEVEFHAQANVIP